MRTGSNRAYSHPGVKLIHKYINNRISSRTERARELNVAAKFHLQTNVPFNMITNIV